jgi:hypothetical protein
MSNSLHPTVQVKKKEYRECATMRNPSAQQKECMDFRKAHKE